MNYAKQLDPHLSAVYLVIKREKTVWLQSVIESYEGLATTRTLEIEFKPLELPELLQELPRLREDCSLVTIFTPKVNLDELFQLLNQDHIREYTHILSESQLTILEKR
jgi:hypothetical protein